MKNAECRIAGAARMAELERAIEAAEARLARLRGKREALLTQVDFDKTISAQVMCAVANAFGVFSLELLSANRAQPLCTARHVCIFLLRKKYGWNFHEIARAFGKRNHCSAMHAVRSIADRISVDAGLRQRVSDISGVLA